ncbi:rRNA large subunit pseudouridine synthase E [Orbaceae bacterium ESL0727]|nr:rRNA large subunit pseudouridine synthase E [Orbaceae bacterium ESL0727]
MTSLIAFNKPFNVICQFSAHPKYKTLKDYIALPSFYPAGRLDTDSEGLLLLTSDGKLQAKIASPQFKLPKTYWVQVEGQITKQALTILRQGVQLKDFHTAPAIVEFIPEPTCLWARNPPIRERKNIPTSWVSITITEGKNRQVRRMCAAVGFPCLRLVRVQIGDYNLFTDNVLLGEWKMISHHLLSHKKGIR